jgi:hypothetical protein
MPGNNGWLSGIVPYGADQTVCLVDSVGAGGTVYRDTEIENADLETMSADIAAEIQMRCDMDGAPVPDHLTDFVRTHTPSTNTPVGSSACLLAESPVGIKTDFPGSSNHHWQRR